MPFGLKNAGATYQRCIQNCLHDQIGRNVHAYVDDIVVKSKTKSDLIADLTETFNNLRRYNMRLNPENAFSGYQPESCSTSSFPREESKLTRTRSKL